MWLFRANCSGAGPVLGLAPIPFSFVTGNVRFKQLHADSQHPAPNASKSQISVLRCIALTGYGVESEWVTVLGVPLTGISAKS